MTPEEMSGTGGLPQEPPTKFEKLGASLSRHSLLRLPGLVVASVRLVWRASRREFLTTAILQVLGSAGLAVQLLVIKQTLSSLLSSGGGDQLLKLLPGLIILALTAAMVNFASVVQREQERILTELVKRYTDDRILDVTSSVPLEALESPAFLDQLQRARLGAGMRPYQIANGLLGLLRASASIVAIGIVLFILQPILVALVFLALGPLWFATTRSSKSFYRFSWNMTPAERQRTYLQNILSASSSGGEVRTYGMAGFFRAKYDALYAERIDGMRRLSRQRLQRAILATLASSSMMFGIVVYLVYFGAHGRTGLATMAAAAVAVFMLAERLRGLSYSAASLFEASLFIADFASFIEEARPAASDRRHLAAPDGFCRLTVENLSYTYPRSATPALVDVSIEIRAGETVALVGANGSGKTTLAKLLSCLYVPSSGRVLWDDIDAADVDPQQLQRSIAVVFQDFGRYQATAHDNIAVGRLERMSDRESVVEAAVQAGAAGFLEKLPNGYDTILGRQVEGGHALSVGQWQRLALARALIRQAPFWIFDEPTASLDPRAEHELFTNIRSLSRGNAVLLISHRFSTVRFADRIYVMEKGRIIESGNHDHLMQLNGLYAELFSLQASVYMDRDRSQSSNPGGADAPVDPSQTGLEIAAGI